MMPLLLIWIVIQALSVWLIAKAYRGRKPLLLCGGIALATILGPLTTTIIWWAIVAVMT